MESRRPREGQRLGVISVPGAWESGLFVVRRETCTNMVRSRVDIMGCVRCIYGSGR